MPVLWSCRFRECAILSTLRTYARVNHAPLLVAIKNGLLAMVRALGWRLSCNLRTQFERFIQSAGLESEVYRQCGQTIGLVNRARVSLRSRAPWPPELNDTSLMTTNDWSQTGHLTSSGSTTVERASGELAKQIKAAKNKILRVIIRGRIVRPSDRKPIWQF